ncbi:hypothetical protein HD554DRAFT_2173656 [Boletus coccyginus]|nr:hypothetical protein HD554DRAFT_2173656 [Boletus coccyginus]
MSGSDDEVSQSMTKPTKVTRQLIEAAWTGSQTQSRLTVTNKSAAAVTSAILPGKRKLKHEGATYLGPSTQKKVKVQHSSGLTQRYQCTRNQEKPADSLGQQ